MATVPNAAASNRRQQPNYDDEKFLLFLLFIAGLSACLLIGGLIFDAFADDDEPFKFQVDSWEAKARSSSLTTSNDDTSRALGLDLKLTVSVCNGEKPVFFESLLVLLASDNDAFVFSSTKIEPFYLRPYNHRKTDLNFGMHAVLDQYDLRKKEFTLNFWGSYWYTSSDYKAERFKIVCKGIKVELVHPSNSSLYNTMHGSSSGSPILCKYGFGSS